MKFRGNFLFNYMKLFPVLCENSHNVPLLSISTAGMAKNNNIETAKAMYAHTKRRERSEHMTEKTARRRHCNKKRRARGHRRRAQNSQQTHSWYWLGAKTLIEHFDNYCGLTASKRAREHALGNEFYECSRHRGGPFAPPNAISKKKKRPTKSKRERKRNFLHAAFWIKSALPQDLPSCGIEIINSIVFGVCVCEAWPGHFTEYGR